MRRQLLQHFVYHVKCVVTNATEFWKITHMGTHEIIRIFMFSGLLIRAGYSFKQFQDFSCNLRY